MTCCFILLFPGGWCFSPWWSLWGSSQQQHSRWPRSPGVWRPWAASLPPDTDEIINWWSKQDKIKTSYGESHHFEPFHLKHFSEITGGSSCVKNLQSQSFGHTNDNFNGSCLNRQPRSTLGAWLWAGPSWTPFNSAGSLVDLERGWAWKLVQFRRSAIDFSTSFSASFGVFLLAGWWKTCRWREFGVSVWSSWLFWLDSPFFFLGTQLTNPFESDFQVDIFHLWWLLLPVCVGGGSLQLHCHFSILVDPRFGSKLGPQNGLEQAGSMSSDHYKIVWNSAIN